MLFPIRSEEGAVRRLPVVTWGFLLACTLVFALADISPPEEVATPQRSLAEAAAYWRDHGYLDASPEVLAEVGRDVGHEERDEYITRLKTRAVDWRPKDEAQVAREQSELVRLSQLGVGEVIPEETRANPLYTWGYVAAEGGASTLFSHLFLHGGWLQLLGNMLLLVLAGASLELLWGRAVYALGLLAMGVGGALAHGSFAPLPEQALPLVGSSAMAAGTLGGFLARLWSQDVHYSYFLGAGRNGTFETPAWGVLPVALFVVGLQVVFANVATAPVFVSQLAGLAVAIPMALALWKLGFEDDFAGVAPTGPIESVRSAELAPVQSAPELLALITDYAGKGDLENAGRNWIELTRNHPEVRVAAPTLLRIAPSLVKRGQAKPAALAMRHALDSDNEGLTSGMALRILDEQRAVDPAIALLAAERALEIGKLQDAKRERLCETIDELRAIVEAGGELPEAEAVAMPALRTASKRSAANPSGDRGEDGSKDRAEAPAAEPSAPVTEPERAGIREDRALRAVPSTPLYPDLKTVEAVPLQIDADSLRLQTSEGQQVALAMGNISAVASAIVAGLGSRPVLLIDLVLGWGGPDTEPLRCVRILSDRFDPRSFTPGVTNPVASIRLLLERILDASGATGLPDSGSAAGRPFAKFDALDAYEREVLHVDR